MILRFVRELRGRSTLALYRALLLGFPGDVRSGHGSEMSETFHLMLTARADRPIWDRLKFVVRAFAEVVLEGISERGRRLHMAASRMIGVEVGPLGGPEYYRQGSGRSGGEGGGPLGSNQGGVGMLIQDFMEDLRQAIRGLGRSPVATATLILTLALGIGANTAVFSVLNGVLLAPLPYDEPDELFTVAHELAAVEGAGLQGIPGPDLLDYIAGAPSIESMGSVSTLETNLSDDQGAARITIGWTTPGFFPTLGTTAAAGRMIEPDDWTPRSRAQMEDPSFQPPPMPVMLSYAIWQSRFGLDPDIIGRSLIINGTGMNVIGILPRDFRIFLPPEAGVPSRVDAFSYLPIPLTEGGRAAGFGGVIVARLADGASMTQAVDELEAVNATLHETWPEHGRFGTRIAAAPLHDGVVGPSSSLIWLLFGAIGLVLVIAVINVANLLLVRASTRHQEFAVRAALGVSQGRIIRKLLTESLVLSMLGAAAGLALATFGVQLLVALAPVDIPRLDEVGIEAPVLFFTLIVTTGAAVLFGLVPASVSARADGRTLVSSRGALGGSKGSLRLRNGLILGEVALSVVLVAGAGLLTRSFTELSRVDPGYEPEGAVAVEMALPFFTYRELDRRQAFFAEVQRRALEIPGVTQVGVSPGLPLTDAGGTWSAPYAVGSVSITDENAPRARYRTGSVGYIEALGARMADGRSFEAADVITAGQPGVEIPVLVDATFAAQNWPGQAAIGQNLQISVAAYIGQGRQEVGRVIGVVESMRNVSLTQPDEPTIWIPFEEYASLEGALVMRGSGDPGEMAAAVRGILSDVDPGVPVYDVRALDADLARAGARSRYALILLGVFALTALILAAVGLYGVISTTVQLRTREIGVRLALGAESTRISQMVILQAGRLVAGGLAIGLVAAVFSGPVLQSMLYQVAPSDPATLAGTAVVLALVGLFAGWLPAYRASRLNPVDALRSD